MNLPKLDRPDELCNRARRRLVREATSHLWPHWRSYKHQGETLHPTTFVQVHHPAKLFWRIAIRKSLLKKTPLLSGRKLFGQMRPNLRFLAIKQDAFGGHQHWRLPQKHHIYHEAWQHHAVMILLSNESWKGGKMNAAKHTFAKSPNPSEKTALNVHHMYTTKFGFLYWYQIKSQRLEHWNTVKDMNKYGGSSKHGF